MRQPVAGPQGPLPGRSALPARLLLLPAAAPVRPGRADQTADEQRHRLRQHAPLAVRRVRRLRLRTDGPRRTAAARLLRLRGGQPGPRDGSRSALRQGHDAHAAGFAPVERQPRLRRLREPRRHASGQHHRRFEALGDGRRSIPGRDRQGRGYQHQALHQRRRRRGFEGFQPLQILLQPLQQRLELGDHLRFDRPGHHLVG